LEQPTTLKHTVPSYTYPTGGTWLITLASGGGGGGGGGVGVGDGGGGGPQKGFGDLFQKGAV